MASASNLERSRLRMERTGYFRKVGLDTSAVPNSVDQVDVVYEVEEELSGSLTFSVGASSSDTFISLAVSQRNFLGTGRDVTADLLTRRGVLNFNLRVLDPFATTNGISNNYNLFVSRTDFGNVGVAGYISNSFGGDLSIGRTT